MSDKDLHNIEHSNMSGFSEYVEYATDREGSEYM